MNLFTLSKNTASIFYLRIPLHHRVVQPVCVVDQARGSTEPGVHYDNMILNNGTDKGLPISFVEGDGPRSFQLAINLTYHPQKQNGHDEQIEKRKETTVEISIQPRWL
jgi:hypothetical protein